MSTPDPQLVRELARKHLLANGRDVGMTVIRHFGSGALGEEQFEAWCDAVQADARLATRTVSWPDEKSPAELAVTLDGLIEAAHRRRSSFDEDVRAVAEACAGVVDGTPPQPIRHEYAVRRLWARFADRIAALDGCDVEGGTS